MDDNESKWMAGMIQYYGEAKAMDLLRKLAAQEIQFRTGHTLLQTLARRRRARGGGRRLRQRRRPVEKRQRADRMDQRRAGHWFDLRPRGRQGRARTPTRRVCSMIFCCRARAKKMIAAAGYYVPRTDVASPILKETPRQKPKSCRCQ